jgi:hypothetical protein
VGPVKSFPADKVSEKINKLCMVEFSVTMQINMSHCPLFRVAYQIHVIICWDLLLAAPHKSHMPFLPFSSPESPSKLKYTGGERNKTNDPAVGIINV